MLRNKFTLVGVLKFIAYRKCKMLSWLVWLSELSASLRTKGLLVPFPVGAHAWVVGQVPSGGGAHKRQPHTDVSFPLLLLPFPSL